VSQLVDVGRRNACEHLARLMADHSDTAHGAFVASELGARFGWSAQRLADLRARGFPNRTEESLLDADQPLSCDSLRLAREKLLRRALTPYSSTPPQSR
jgi:hypothetical protein